MTIGLILLTIEVLQNNDTSIQTIRRGTAPTGEVPLEGWLHCALY